MSRSTLWKLIVFTILAFWFLVFWTSVKAQAVGMSPVGPYLVKPTCLPVSGNFRMAANSTGLCCKWDCPDGTWYKFCGTWTEQAKVSSRVSTIQKAADPLKSLQDAGKRFKIVPLDDPSMAGMPELE